MKKVKYKGRHDAVEVELPSGGEEVVEHGKVLETTDEHAAALVEQDENWEPVGWKPKPAPEAAAEPDSDQPADDAGEKE